MIIGAEMMRSWEDSTELPATIEMNECKESLFTCDELFLAWLQASGDHFQQWVPRPHLSQLGCSKAACACVCICVRDGI